MRKSAHNSMGGDAGAMAAVMSQMFGGASFGGDAGLEKQLRGFVSRLNKEHFNNELGYREIVEAAGGDVANALRVLEQLEEKKDEVKDPTAYATSAIRKSAHKSMGGDAGAMAAV